MNFFYFILFLPFLTPHPPYKKIQLSGFAQGTTWHINYFSPDSTVTQSQIDSILNKIDSSLSLYKSYSTINKFNNAEYGCIIDNHFIAVIKKSLATYKDTKGIFDITVQPLVKAWGFGNKKIDHLPDSIEIKSLLACIGSNRICLKKNMLFKKDPCITIDLNGIAQGYTVDVLADFLLSRKIVNFIVEVGGEIRIKGHRKPSEELMKIGIESPADNESDDPFMQKIISPENGAVTTSGSYRKFYERNGKKLNHLIDPSTGYPVNNELISVTVFAKDAITADAYDNALMVMGLKKALAFVEARKELAAYFIYNNKGTITDSSSKRFKKLFK